MLWNLHYTFSWKCSLCYFISCAQKLIHLSSHIEREDNLTLWENKENNFLVSHAGMEGWGNQGFTLLSPTVPFRDQTDATVRPRWSCSWNPGSWYGLQDQDYSSFYPFQACSSSHCYRDSFNSQNWQWILDFVKLCLQYSWWQGFQCCCPVHPTCCGVRRDFSGSVIKGYYFRSSLQLFSIQRS